MQIPRHRGLTLALTGACVLAVATARAGSTPVQKCQAAKNKIAGQYAACRQNAEATFAATGNGLKYGAALTKCGTKFTSGWQKTIVKAAKVNATCLDAPLTEADFQTILDESTDDIATALAGLGLTDCPANLTTCQSDLATCQTAPDGRRLTTGQTTCSDSSGAVTDCAGTGQDGEVKKGLVRAYLDNGDGTVTDEQTGLIWEKLSDDGTIHDMDDLYTWADAFATKIAMLNSMTFAGYPDWRVPNVNELQSLADYGKVDPAVDEVFNAGCIPGCSVTTCSCTFAGPYWSATSYREDQRLAWEVGGSEGGVGADFKGGSRRVRAVRGGS